MQVAIDGNQYNHSLDNLKWGTRSEQSMIAMQNPVNFKRVQKMGRKFGKRNWKKNLVTDGSSRRHCDSTIKAIRELSGRGINPTEISRRLSISRSSIYRYTRCKA